MSDREVLISRWHPFPRKLCAAPKLKPTVKGGDCRASFCESSYIDHIASSYLNGLWMLLLQKFTRMITLATAA